jgi:hypothetical protein
MLFEIVLVMYKFPVNGSKAAEEGRVPTDMVLITILEDPFITDTLFEQQLAMYTYPFNESKAIVRGLEPTAMVLITVLVEASITVIKGDT